MPIASILDEKPNTVNISAPLIETSSWRSYKAFIDAGFPEDIPRPVLAPYEAEQRFLTAVDLSKGSIERQILRMVRQKVKGVEYLTFTENWYATDWKNAPVNPIIDRLEGILRLPRIVPKINEKGQKIGTDLEGTKTEYEIPFSKKAVDDWLKETGTDKSEIIFTFRTDKRRDNCNYDQFVNTTWAQANDIMMREGGFELVYVESLKPETKKPA